jgi:phosphomannomutase
VDYIQIYSNFLKKFLKPEQSLKVIFDCSNGTTGKVLSELFRNFQFPISNFQPRIIFINKKPDGNFPGHGPNPLAAGAMSQLQKAVLKHRADLGVIFDVDGDRVFFVDDRGRQIHADETGYLLLQELKPKSYVISVISGRLLRKNVSSSRFQVSRVGHYFFKKLMREKKIPLGLEHSGHYYFGFPKENFYFDSGILAAIHVINFVSKLNQPLSAYLDKLPKYYRSGEINFKVKSEKLKVKSLERVEQYYKNQRAKISKLDGLTAEFPDFWINLRPSNTENLLRLNLEAKNKNILNKEIANLKRLVKT